jgi:hypothetical protein
MVITGIVLTSVGAAGFILGLGMLSVAAELSAGDQCFPDLPCNPRDHSGLVTGGLVAAIAGGVAAAVGVPLILYGSKKVPVTPEPRAARLAPEVRLGPLGGALRWQY